MTINIKCVCCVDEQWNNVNGNTITVDEWPMTNDWASENVAAKAWIKTEINMIFFCCAFQKTNEYLIKIFIDVCQSDYLDVFLLKMKCQNHYKTCSIQIVSTMKMNLIDFKGERGRENNRFIIFFMTKLKCRWFNILISNQLESESSTKSPYVDPSSFFSGEKVKCANCNFGILLPFFLFSHNVRLCLNPKDTSLFGNLLCTKFESAFISKFK